MFVRSWLTFCTSSTCTSATETVDSQVTAGERMPPEHHEYYRTSSLISDTSSDIPSSMNSETSLQTDVSNNSSLPSYSSLPSVPSLQKNSTDFSNGVSFNCHLTLKPHSGSIHSVAVSDDLLYVATSTKNISVFDLKDLKQIEIFGHGDGAVKSFAFTSGNIFTAHQDYKIRIWLTFPRHKLTTSLPTVKDRLLRFILPRNYVQVRRHKKRLWIEHSDAVSGLAINKDQLYSVSWDKSLKIWQISDLRCLESINKAHDDAINAISVSNDGLVYTGSADSRIKVWGKAIGEKKHSLVATLERHKSAVNALALSADGSVLYSGACDRSILVWEREDSAQHMVVTGALRGHRRAILCLVIVSDLLFSGSADQTVRIWMRGSDNRYCSMAVLEGHERAVKSLAARFDPGSGFASVYSGSLDGEIKVWQVWVSNLESSSSSSNLLNSND